MDTDGGGLADGNRTPQAGTVRRVTFTTGFQVAKKNRETSSDSAYKAISRVLILSLLQLVDYISYLRCRFHLDDLTWTRWVAEWC